MEVSTWDAPDSGQHTCQYTCTAVLMKRAALLTAPVSFFIHVHALSRCCSLLCFSPVQILSTSHFELSEETLACGDEALDAFAPPHAGGSEKLKGFAKGAPSGDNDPFAASGSLLMLGATGPRPLQGPPGLQSGRPQRRHRPRQRAPRADPAAMLLAELEGERQCTQSEGVVYGLCFAHKSAGQPQGCVALYPDLSKCP